MSLELPLKKVSQGLLDTKGEEMPLYVYRCADCKTEQERNVSMEDRDFQNCEECSEFLIRQMRFSGSVWAPTSGGMR